ncbi:MAG: type III pantothenate kinase [Kangiellaceae bacterium]|nr:type III pantothenate kinase [Kangiellaceae bacterium]
MKFLVLDSFDLVSKPEIVAELQYANDIEELLVALAESGFQAKGQNALIASVKKEEETRALCERLKRWGMQLFIARTTSSNCGVQCAYLEPSKLGVDRWLAILGAHNPNKHVGIVDIGTALTLDIVQSSGKHLGGHILPGTKLIEESLHQTDGVITRRHRSNFIEFGLGQTTTECVEFGILQMFAGYLQSTIELACNQQNITSWVFTGGGGHFWSEWSVDKYRSSPSLHFEFQPMIVFMGLIKLFQEQRQKPLS